MLRIIPTRVHGVLDYLSAVILIGTPWVLGFGYGGAAHWLLVLIGIGVIVMSACTAYEFGAMKLISMPTHLIIDIAAGVLLVVSPWLFGFHALVAWPHVVLGLMIIVISVMTDTRPVPKPPGTLRSP